MKTVMTRSPNHPTQQRSRTPRRAVALAKLLAVALGGLMLTGCVTATIQEVREAETGMLAGESVVGLGP